MIIREALPADDAAAGDLRVRAYAKRYAENGIEVPQGRWDDLRDMAGTRRNATVLIAEEAGRIVATVALYRPGAADAEAWIPNAADLRFLAIDPDLQGRGISGRILDAAEAWVWKEGYDAVCLHTRREATGIARLYAARGYVRDPAGDFVVARGNVSLEAWLKRRDD